MDSGQDESEVASGATCPDNSTLTYDNFGKEFFQSYCLGCHSEDLSGAARGGAPGDHNFDTAELIREQIDHIDETAAAGPDAVNTFMPPSGKQPSEEERKKLGEWLACDAP
jgi:mono/diheme cytochrome c family protein